jgi:hypothetical protein
VTSGPCVRKSGRVASISAIRRSSGAIGRARCLTMIQTK